MIEIKEEDWEWVDPKELKVDGENPNKMTDKEKESLWSNIQRFGWNMPIITDKKLLVADGEQKLIVALEHKLPKVPILKKELSDNERRIIRQSMNKLRGSHDDLLDAAEYKRILENIGLEELTSLTAISEQEVLNLINSMDKDSQEIVEKVKNLGKIVITCPFCKKKFEREDQ